MKLEKIKKIVHILAIALVLFLVSCEEKTIIIDNTKNASNETKTEIVNIRQNITLSKNETQMTENENGTKIRTVPIAVKNPCRSDAECGGRKEVSSRCWQKSIYTTFNDSKCIANRCMTTTEEFLTEVCDERSQQICQNGKCVQLQRLICKDTDGDNKFVAGKAYDIYGNEFSDVCLNAQTVLEFFCNIAEYPQKVFNETRICENGCINGRCNPEPIVLNQFSNNSS